MIDALIIIGLVVAAVAIQGVIAWRATTIGQPAPPTAAQ
jgi:hypothetical protein